MPEKAYPQPGQNGRMNPDPLLMLMRSMSQRQHGPRPYQGILGASEEKVVFTEDEATSWIEENYRDGERGTLIRIHVQGIWDKANGNVVEDYHGSDSGDLLQELLTWFDDNAGIGVSNGDAEYWIKQIQQALGLPVGVPEAV